MRRLLAALAVLLLAIGVGPGAALASNVSGQVSFGQAEVEPAFDGTTGDQIFLLIPTHASLQPTAAWSPLYLPVYPTASTIGTFDCLPTNCDHVNSLSPDLVASLGLDSVYPGGVVKGHDHITGVGSSGTGSPVTRHVFLVLFTPQGVADGAIDHELTTVAGIQDAIAAGDAVGPIDTGLMVHASVVSSATYQHGS